MENNNLRDPGVPYAVNGGTPSPRGPAPTPLFADAMRTSPPAISGITQSAPATSAIPLSVDALSANPTPPPPQPGTPAATAPQTPKKRRDIRKIAQRSSFIVLALLLIGGGAFMLDRLRTQNEQKGSLNNSVASTNIPLSEFANSGSLSLLGTQSLTVNGQLRANESFVLAPQNQPATGERGQIYYDNTSNQLAYYNGTQFITLPGTNFVQTFQGQSGNVTLTAGNGITIDGTTFSNNGVTSFGGQTGDITLGNGLSIAGGSLQATGVQSLTSGSVTLSVTDDGAGNLTITNSGAGSGTITSAGGTSGRIPLFTAAQNIEDSIMSQSGGTITVTGNLAVTGTLSLGTPLSVANGGTGANTFATNGVIVGNGTSALSAVTAAGSGLCLLSTGGAPAFGVCPSASGSVSSVNGLTGALTVANASGVGTTITIDDASTSQKGIAQFNSTNFTVTSGVANTIQDITVSAAPTFGRLTLTSSQATNPMLFVNNTNGSGSGNLIDLQVAGVSRMAVTPAGAMTLTGTLNGQTISSAANFTGTLAVAGAASLNGGASVTGTLTANTITPTAAMTVGATNQTLTLQGSASTTVSATNGANTTTVSFQSPTANVTYRLLTATAGTYDICTTVGNCVGTGGGVSTSGGTTNTLAKFTGSQTLGDSIISDNGTTVTIGGTLAVNTITPTGALTIGSTSQNLTLQGAATTRLTATSGGIINTLTFATPSGSNKTITIPNASGTVVVSASAPLAIDAAGNITCTTCVTGTTVSSLNSLTGALTIANATTGGSTITINDASTSQKGIAQFNSTNFSAASGVINTIQDIAISSAPTFGRLTVTSSQASNGMLLINNTNVGASGNLLDVQLNGSSRLAVTPAGAMTLASTLNGQTISSTASFTGTLGVTGLASLNGGATVTGTLTANNLTPTSALTVGATTQSFTVQGSATSTITATNGASTTTMSFQTPTANVNYRLLTAAAGTYDICTTVGNCAGVGGGVTTAGGTTNTLAKFTTSSAIGDSIITDDGSTVTIGGTLAVNTIAPSAAMTIGSTSQNLTLQGAVTKLTATNGGVTNTLQFATPASTNKTITLPNATGTVAVSASGPLAIDAAGNITCSTCVTSGGGGGGVGAVDSLNGLTGALTIANASATGSTITIDDASTSQKGIAQFNSTNFSASGGVVNTIQDIAISAAPTFGRLTVTSSQASNPMLLVNNTNTGASGNLLDVQLNGSSRLSVSPAGAMTLVGALNGQTISSATSLTGTLAVAGLASLNGGATVTGTLTTNTITPTSSLTVGATSQSFLVQGSAASTITATNGASTTTLAFQTPTAAVTYRFLTAAAGTYDVCTTVGNCLGVGGGVTTAGGTPNALAKFTTSSAIGDSIITDDGSTVTIGGTLAVNTLTPTAALTIGATGQNLTLQGAVTNITSTAGGTTNSLTFATPSGANKTITVPNASGTLVVSASGPLAIDAAGNITCSTCTTTSTAVTSLNSLTGALTIANASTSGSTITLDDASTSQKGIAQFNSTNFSASSGVINTIQNINSTAAPTFGQLTLTSSQASAAMLTVNNTNVSAAGNLIDLQLNGSSRFAVSPAGALTLSSTVNGQTISSAASLTGTLDVAGLASLNGGATVTGTLTANTLTPTSSLTVGATSQSFLLQGNASSTLTATNGANTTTVSFQTPTASVNYRLPTAAAGNYDICTTAGNCSSGGGVTTAGGTTGRIAKFTGSSAIGDSLLSESGSVVSVTGTMAASTALQTPLIDTATAVALNIGTTNATAINLNQNTSVTGTLAVSSLGTANTATVLCRNSSNQIAACNTTGTGAVFVQGGNTFGAAGNLGTNDSNALNLRTNSTTRLTVAANGSDVTLSSNTDFLLQGATAYISNPQGGTNSESFGLNAVTGGFDRVTVVGRSATASASDATALGYGTTAGSGSIALGSGATTTAANQLVIGSNGASINQVSIGNGVTNASPVGFTLQGTGGSGSNIAGATVTIAGGAGTGTGNGGDIQFKIATPTTSSSTLNTTATVATLSGINGSALFKNTANSTSAFTIQNSASAELFAVDSTSSIIRMLGNNIGTLGAFSTNGGVVLSTARESSDAVVVNGYAYVVGGCTTAGARSTTVQYAKINADGSTGTWATTQAFPTANCNGAATTYNGYIYVNGDTSSAGTADEVYYAKPAADGTICSTCWLTAANPIPQDLAHHRIIAYGGYMYAVGGATLSGTNNLRLYYARLNSDGSIGSWSNNNGAGSGWLPAARRNFGINISNGYMYIVGGRNASGGGGQNTVYYGKIRTDGNVGNSAGTTGVTASTTNAMTISRASVSTAILNGYLYAFGGETTNGTAVNSYSYAPLAADGTTGSWTDITSPVPFAGARSGAPVVTANGYVYMFGGYLGGAAFDNVWYASGGRVKIGGSLDLLNQGGETLTDGSSGGQLSAGNTTIAGTLNVAGQASLKDGATVGNNLTVNGLAAIQTTTNAANAFQILNSVNASVFNVGTTGNSANLITNGNFEYDESGWIIAGGTSVSKSSAQAYIGSGSLLATLNSGGTSGARYNLTLSDSTAYSYSFYAQLSSGTFTDMRFGYNNGSSDTDCATDKVVVIGTWTRYQCTFTTPASHTGTPYVYIKQGSAAAHDIYIDAVQLIPGSDIGGYYDGKINSGAAIFSGPFTAQNDTNSTTGFNVLNSTGQAMFTIDTVNSAVKIGGGDVNAGTSAALLVLDTKTSAADPTGVVGAMYYNSSTQQFRCYRSINGTDGNWEACGTNPVDRGWEVYEEFLGGGITDGSIGQLGWHAEEVSGPTYNYNSGMLPTADRPGTFEIATTTTNGSGSTLTLAGVGGTTSTIIAAGNNVKTAAGFDSNLTNLVYRVGLHSELASNVRPVSGVWWEAAPSVNANWQYCYGNGTTATCAATSTAVAATVWFKLEIRVNTVGNSASSADFFLNGTKFSVSGVTIDSTNQVNPAISCFNSTASDRYCSTDYFHYRGTTSTAR